jgi:hypothetical protein
MVLTIAREPSKLGGELPSLYDGGQPGVELLVRRDAELRSACAPVMAAGVCGGVDTADLGE